MMLHATAVLKDLPELYGVRKIFFDAWYDGPVSGLAEHDGHERRFIMVTNDEPGGTWDLEPRVYVLHSLPPARLAEAWESHRAFAAAGLPGCLHQPPCPERDDAEPLEALWERCPPEPDEPYADEPMIGWFRDTEAA